MKVYHGISLRPRALKRGDTYMIALPVGVWVALRGAATQQAKQVAEWIYNHEYAHILQWERGCPNECMRREICADNYAERGELLC